MIDLPDEPFVALKDASKFYPDRPHISSVLRHVTIGVTVGGRRIKLQSIRSGGKRLTCRSWVLAFIEECSRDPDEVPADPGPTETERQRRAKAASAALEAIGA